MTYLDAIAALIILSVFLFGFAQIFFPAYYAWEKANVEFNTAKTIHFVSESFKSECKKTDRNIARWRRAVSTAKELQNSFITELIKDEEVFALKLTCVISGEKYVILGLCRP